MTTTDGVIRWGIVGTGGYARRACAPSFADVPQAQLVGVASSQADRAAAFAAEWDLPLATDDIGVLCEDADVNALWIASPSYLHAEHGRAALAAGKHVLMEKPLALTAKEAHELVELAAERNLVLATGYQARYVPAHVMMRDLIADGTIGDVVVARTFYGMHRDGPPQRWRYDRATARWGTLADIGTHHLDLLRMLVGEIEAIGGFAAHRRHYPTEDTATVAIRFESGAVGSLTASSVVGNPGVVVEVIGTDGSVVAEGTSPDGQGTARLIPAGGDPIDITGDRPPSFVAQLETISRVMLGESLPYASGADGARNVELLERIDDAAS